jgi:hypothetical protein
VGVEVSHDSILERGEHVRTTALIETRAPEQIEVHAKIWSKPISFVLARSPAVDEAMPAILIATSPGLTDDETLDVAMRGGVVSPVTSYLAELGGVDPVSPPLVLTGSSGGFGFGSVSTCGCGCCGIGGRLGYYIDHGRLLEQVRALAEACGAGGGSIELTEDEIVDVEVDESPGAECLVEAIWSMRAPEEYASYGRTMLSF